MKIIRLISMLLLLGLVVGLSGCDEVWSVDFTEVYDVNDWMIFGFQGGPGSHNLYSAGLLLDYYGATGPYGFSGDFTMTVSFLLDLDEAETVDLVVIGIGDGSELYTEKHITLTLSNLGSETSEVLIVREIFGAEWDTIVSRDSIPGIRRHGVNTFKLVKTGDRIKTYFNGTLLCDYLLEHYDLMFSFPIIASVQESSSKLYFQSVKFTYSGPYISRP